MPDATPAIERALLLADLHPLTLPQDLIDERTPGYARFLGIAGWLQVEAGQGPITLPLREVGAVLGMEGLSISRYRQWGERDGFLLRLPGPRNRPTLFRFDVSRFPILRERAAQGVAEAFLAAKVG